MANVNGWIAYNLGFLENEDCRTLINDIGVRNDICGIALSVARRPSRNEVSGVLFYGGGLVIMAGLRMR